MKVLRIVGSFGFISNGYWIKPKGGSNFIGGTQIQSYILTKNLSEKGIKQEVYTRNARVKDFAIKNVSFYSCGMRGDWLFPFYSFIYSVNKKYDLVHLHMGISPFIPLTGLLLSKLKKIPLVCTVNLSWNKIQGYNIFYKVIARRVEKLVLKMLL